MSGDDLLYALPWSRVYHRTRQRFEDVPPTFRCDNGRRVYDRMKVARRSELSGRDRECKRCQSL